MSIQDWIKEFSSNFEENSDELELFVEEMKSFSRLHKRAMKQKDTRNNIEWGKVNPIRTEKLLQYSELRTNQSSQDVDPSKVIVLKLCGGLGTTMGLKKPKGLVVVRDGKSFLDFAIEQTINTNEKYQVNVPLVLMTSFFTHEAIVEYISQHPLQEKLDIFTFQQKKFPRISADTHLPISKNYSDPSHWSPPGHGDVYDSFLKSEVYMELKKENKTHLFISNIDNLGAIVDLSIFSQVIQSKIDFCLEVTRKTLNDVKGGTVVEIDNRLKLLEVAQVPLDHLNDFFSIDKFRIFNTNSMWISLLSLEKNLPNILSPIIFNRKIMKKDDNGKSSVNIIQLETACGSALEFFEKVSVIQVPRIRRVTVKNCQDLFLAQSKCLYETVDSGTKFVRRRCGNSNNMMMDLPVIRFIGEEWRDLNVYNQRIGNFGIPNISKLKSLEVKGEVIFKSGEKIHLEGDVTYDGTNEKIIL